MKNFFVLLLLLTAALSCAEKFSPDASPGRDDSCAGHGMIVLGEKLEDPYTLENMSKAFTALYPTKADRLPLEATDLYVRFLPKTEEEFGQLEEMGLFLMDHPVDYRIVEEGDYYHDPKIAEGEITWQYAVVDKDFSFPEHIRHELIDKCYIYDNDKTTKADGVDWAEVERESFRLTGNEDMLLPQTRDGEKASPAGRITIEDPAAGDGKFGVSGVKVSCNCFVRFGNAYTDEDGYYKMNRSFSSNPRYRIVFKNKFGFGIGFNLLLCPASFSSLGKHSPAGVDVHIDASSERKLFARAVVNNAAYDYYKKCQTEDASISKPAGNLRIWLFHSLRWSAALMLQQGALIDGSLVSDFLGEYSFLVKMFLPDVTVGLRDAYDYEEIYTRTVHELAHASHFVQAGKDYWNKYVKYVVTSFVSSGFVTYGVGTGDGSGNCEVAEMWAYYMQTSMHNERYPDRPAMYGGGFWFSPQIFMYLDERGLSRYRIFGALSSDIENRDRLKKKLISLYPQFKSSINMAFSRYN